MYVFLFFSTAFGLGNLYAFLKLSDIYSPGTLLNVLSGLIFLLLFLSPVCVHLLSFRGPDRPVRVLAYISYLWVSFLIIFFPLALVLELYNYIVQYSNIASGNGLNSWSLTSAQIFFFPFSVSVIFNTYGYIEAQLLSAERLTVRTSKLPEGIDKITIAQISDLHLGIINRDNVLDRVIKKLEKAEPDLIVSTGDLVEGVVFHINYLAEKIKKVNARLGKFAVLGNHEFFGGIKHSIEFIENSGFTILRGQGIAVENMINIAGVDDLAEEKKQRYNNSEIKDEKDALSGLSLNIFTILLKHRSDVNNNSTGLFDLQLSGHTHKGQIFPINLITPFIFQHHSGFIRLPNRSALYVSRGAGTAGPPIRFLSRPEITIIDVVRE